MPQLKRKEAPAGSPPRSASAERGRQNQFDGLLQCARYAFMPNKLQFCGGNKNSALFEYCVNAVSEPPLETLLREFRTLHPYLRLIADANKISDPFDHRVVEAYWIGNELLENIRMNKFYWHLIDGLELKKKIKLSEFDKLALKIPLGAKPHHSFHVFNVYLRTGHLPIEHTLETMNSCRIGWGRIKKILKNEIEIKTSDLIVRNNRLGLGEPAIKKIAYKFIDQCFLKNPKENDWVSYHWNWACEIINEQQVSNLKKYSLQNMTIAAKRL
ncbi:MAG: DUF6390 family protein [Parcubacteria group bacterium]